LEIKGVTKAQKDRSLRFCTLRGLKKSELEVNWKEERRREEGEGKERRAWR